MPWSWARNFTNDSNYATLIIQFGVVAHGALPRVPPRECAGRRPRRAGPARRDRSVRGRLRRRDAGGGVVRAGVRDRDHLPSSCGWRCSQRSPRRSGSRWTSLCRSPGSRTNLARRKRGSAGPRQPSTAGQHDDRLGHPPQHEATCDTVEAGGGQDPGHRCPRGGREPKTGPGGQALGCAPGANGHRSRRRSRGHARRGRTRAGPRRASPGGDVPRGAARYRVDAGVLERHGLRIADRQIGPVRLGQGGQPAFARSIIWADTSTPVTDSRRRPSRLPVVRSRPARDERGRRPESRRADEPEDSDCSRRSTSRPLRLAKRSAS